MSLKYSFLLSLCSLIIISVSPIIAQTSFRPKALVIPVVKDAATLQYVAEIKQTTPLVPVKLTVHLGGYVSSTNKIARCGSAQCNLANVKACGGGICGADPENPISNTGTFGDIRIDVLSIQSTNSRNPGRAVTVLNFIFLCGSEFVLQGLANGVVGIAGLGRSKVALPSQLAAAFSLKTKFALYLSPFGNGVIIFGDGPYDLNFDVSNTASGFLGEPSVKYFIGVASVNVNGKAISTVNPYTVLETSMYKAFVQAFANAMPKVTRVAPVAPSRACFRLQDIDIGFTRIGPFVPQIDLVFHNKYVVWSVHGQNSMVQIGNDVLCLRFVDGGVNPRTSIVIGGRQLENNLLQFDLAHIKTWLGNSLLFERTTCSNFNLTSNIA
ncbi:peptidase A1 domain-containing protein [Citrus sinensis]|uniref:Peptidase A1 domain-containing protein n=1 Tax=Citrus sinensis TaxID=2711 RepID=A0ACB8K0K9_CITSI|nr:peptidase A1 domain-containing protein [Citrus sinensis]